MKFTKIAIVGCASRKLIIPAKVREIYASALFKKSLAHAETLGCPVYVVSAKHGLLELDQVIEPYNERLDTNIHGRRAWGVRTAKQIHALPWTAPHVREVVLLAGADYAGALLHGFAAVRSAELNASDRWFDYRTAEPLKGRQIGERLAWLNEQATSS